MSLLTAGTSVFDAHVASGVARRPSEHRAARNPALRQEYLRAAVALLPRIVSLADKAPWQRTYGCFDRQFWHYRTASFPCQMAQEAVLPLALAFQIPATGSAWHGQEFLRDLAIAGLRFAARSSHRDGSCDDYYPFERALGAAVFTLQAAAEAYRLLALDDGELLAWLQRRARWVAAHCETGRLANHHALAALGLWRTSQLTGDDDLLRAAQRRAELVVSWQHLEGWFAEYDGADPGYQTLTIDCLAKLLSSAGWKWLLEPLVRAVAFAGHFAHVDGTYAGPYGSRGTFHFYSHGLELLSNDIPAAGQLAEHGVQALAAGKTAQFDDDRLVSHYPANWLESWQDWNGQCRGEVAAEDLTDQFSACESIRAAEVLRSDPGPSETPVTAEQRARPEGARFLPEAGLLAQQDEFHSIVASVFRGNAFTWAQPKRAFADGGLVVVCADGRTAVSHLHCRERVVDWMPCAGDRRWRIVSHGPLHWTCRETATPCKQAVFHVGLWTFGRWMPQVVRWLLQRRLITGRKSAPIVHERALDWDGGSCQLHVHDRLELLDPRIEVRELLGCVDQQSAYVAATGVFHPHCTRACPNWGAFVETLNQQRHIAWTWQP